ncbi:unnamed protein product [Orchesella dallaii]|uniref:C2H2-type domain-containing protein n=1 Tax=Orchesella dallaii TaxID=48710 RepID=A0ABP1RIR6_9HEXA
MENNGNLSLIFSEDGSGERDNDIREIVQNEIMKIEYAKVKGEAEEVKKKNTELQSKMSDLEKKNEELVTNNRALITSLVYYKGKIATGNLRESFALKDKKTAEEKAAAAELRASAAELRASAAELKAAASEERCRDLEYLIPNISRVDSWVADVDPIVDDETFSDTSSVVVLQESSPQDVNGVHEHAIVVDIEEENAAAEDALPGTSQELRTSNPGAKTVRKGTHICKCGKSFETSRKLKNHVKNYVENKFRCRLCTRTFRFCHQLRKHQKNAHTLTLDERKHGCCRCGERFTESRDRYYHCIKSHVKELKKERMDEILNAVSIAPVEVSNPPEEVSNPPEEVSNPPEEVSNPPEEAEGGAMEFQF